MPAGCSSWCKSSPSRAVVALVAAIAGGLATAPGALAAPAAAPATARTVPAIATATPAAACQPYRAAPCMFPFPDDRLTVPDRRSATGLRVHLPQAAMPANTSGVQLKVGPYDRADGFSPGASIVLHVPGLDNPAAISRTGAPGLANIGASLARRAPIVLIDQDTGRRQPIWAELDANATSPATTDVEIHPARNLTEGHTYIVALRNLRTSTGTLIRSPGWFERLRAGHRLGRALRAQRTRYQAIFRSLRHARIRVDSHLYEAWNFTVASSRSETGRMLAIRDAAFARLGDRDLADLKAQGRAPAFTVTGSAPLTASGGAPVVAPNGVTFTVVNGTYQVPCYLKVCGPTATAGFHYGTKGLYRTPTQITGNVATTNFECLVPSSATPLTRARIAVYGHGLLGSADEVTDGWMQALASQYDIVFCSTDFWGLAHGDTPADAAALANLNLFAPVVDRLQQGALNSLFLGRLMVNRHGLASNPAFQRDGAPVIETRRLYYDGNSQGGIMGGMLTALAPDWNRAVLGVTGIDYANLLVQRSTDFAPFGTIVYGAYPDQSLHPLILDLMQQLWDRGDPDGYAAQMTTHPLPDTPPHQVLMQVAYGDFQVSMYAAAVEARTVGASAYRPALDPDRTQDTHLFYGLPPITRFPFHGSAIEIWDSGPGRVQPPPLANLAPVAASNNIDPHEDVRNTPAAQLQMSDFWRPSGRVADVCAGAPCHASVFTP
ncbi:MAG TPA: hypothetical protein VFW09_21745 [Solirubrobacteraceae bacterium]|nr:hypothetical protein [Solirubrobacteraceae bacterium]